MQHYRSFLQQGGAVPQEQTTPSQSQPMPQGQTSQNGQAQQDPMQILQEMVMQYSQTMDITIAEQIAQFLMQVFGIQPQGQQQAPVQAESQQGQLPQGNPGQQQVAPPAMRRGGTMQNIQGATPLTKPMSYSYTNRYEQGGYLKSSPTYKEQDATQNFYEQNKSKDEADRSTKSLMYPRVSRILIAAHESRKNNSGII